jgi:hypothetical protein
VRFQRKTAGAKPANSNQMIQLASVLLCLFLTTGAQAHLGESIDAPETKVLTTHPLYTVYETKSDSNQVREYVSKSGKIFGIAWDGLSHPDLAVLLGPDYSQEYQKILAGVDRRHLHHHHVKSKKLEVRLEGHMRAFRGAVHDPSLVPEGVKLHEIQ